MRIIAGVFRGRRLTAPAGLVVRPTSDRLRETLFNILGPAVAGARVLDAFAGTGALGLEALSRGAASATFVERDRRALGALGANIDACGARAACAIIRGDFLAVPVTGAPCDLVLIDPPYEAVPLEDVMTRATFWTSVTGRLVLEHARRRPSPARAGRFVRTRVVTAGDSALSFYDPAPDVQPA